MDYKDYMKQMGEITSPSKKKISKPKKNSIIEDIKNNINEEFNLNERIVYDRNAGKPKASSKMVEMIKRQMKGMQGYTLSRVYETRGSYRMVFESEQDGNFDISIKERK